MIFKTFVLLGLMGTSVSAEMSHLRGEAREEVSSMTEGAGVEHLDLELIVDGKRELFPLLPGTKCPTGHNCRVRNSFPGEVAVTPMVTALKKNMKTPLAMSLDWSEFNTNMNTLVVNDNYCSRRHAMAKAAGIAAGVSVATVSKPAYAAETKEVKMGSDSGLLAFVPNKVSICKGDSVKW